MEQEIRKTAIKRFIQGEKPKQIYESLNRSKPWFFKWLKRYQSGDLNWFKGQSRAPKHSPRALRLEDKKRIVETRRQLDAQRLPNSVRQPSNGNSRKLAINCLQTAP